MATFDEVSMLRVTDDFGHQVVVGCVPGSGSEFMGVGEDGSWAEHCRPITSVIIDVSGAVQLTNHKDVASMAAWLSAAAVWLRTRQLADGEGND
ncbi:hypothetical protein EBZ80_11845 [bacterium]|nr:hypothetical protein [bacterium]